jgi:hypothetical protein
MVILIFLFACVYALLHFIWEGILAPSLRHNIRLDLFALRDNLRRLKINNPELPNDAFNTVQDGLNGAIKHLSDIDIPLLVYCDSIVKRDAKLKEVVEKRRDVVLSANSKELIEIAGQIRQKIEHASRINSGGWYLYIIPAAAGFLCLKSVCSPIFTILYIPNWQLEKIMPERETRLPAVGQPC